MRRTAGVAKITERETDDYDWRMNACLYTPKI
jgi:hypothetical protein